MKNYLSFGGGVNSVALHLLLIEQGVDFESVFVNHGTDWPETYQYVAGFQWWLKQNGYKPITILYPNDKGFSRLIDLCVANKITPSFRNRWCTDRYKKIPLHTHFGNQPSFVLIGISSDEAHRAKIQTYKNIEYRYPLIENNIDRNGCKSIISNYGLPIPMKSGCYICPFQRKSQWVELRQKHPCLFSSAVDLENQQITRRKNIGSSKIYLSGAKKPLSAIVDENQKMLFEQDEYPPCQCGL